MASLARSGLVVLGLLALSCAKAPPPEGQAKAAAAASTVTISIVGTNDLHGRLKALPILAGYVANLRKARAVDGGVLLLDGGDMFQGTLESNLTEGASVVRGYNALGYTAVAVGNHEFDYGPVGPAVVPPSALQKELGAGAALPAAGSAAGAGSAAAAGEVPPNEDPLGALKARAGEARFPFLMANVVLKATGAVFTALNLQPTATVEVHGVKVGLIGLTTEDMPHTTVGANVAALKVAPLAETLATRAKELRAQGAQVIVALAHAGGDCEDVEKPRDLSSCGKDQEIFKVAAALPPGLVDVIVGGHTHAAVAHYVNGVAIIESLAYGRAFGRVDVMVKGGKVVDTKIYQPKNLCAFWDKDLPEFQRWESCKPSAYEGTDVRPDPALLALIQPDLEQARARHEEKLGVTLTASFKRIYDAESSLGNLFATLMLKSRPADVAMTNGGGLRADLPAGALTYGSLYQAAPFDNAFTKVHLTGAQFREVVRHSLQRKGGIISIAGMRAKAECKGKDLVVTLTRDNGRPVKDAEPLTVITSDFLATGGDGAFTDLKLPESAAEQEPGAIIREYLADELKNAGTLDPSAYLDPKKPRMSYPGPRPVVCGAPGTEGAGAGSGSAAGSGTVPGSGPRAGAAAGRGTGPGPGSAH